MKKLAIAISSTSGMDYVKNKDEFHVARLTVIFDGKEYVDYTDIKAEDFYQKMLDKPDADISTSQVSVGQFVDLYNDVKSKGYEELLVISISSTLSGTYQGAVLAKTEVEGLNVQVFDSLNVSYGEVVLAEKALELHKAGKSLDEIIAALKELRNKIEIYILVDTLKYLVKNGRLSVTSGFLGGLLKIKPILRIEPDGRLKPYEKVRTSTKAQKRIFDILMEKTAGKNVEYFVAYTTNLDLAKEYAEKIKAERAGASVTLIPLTPVVGAHAGPGTLGLGYAELD